MTLIRINLMAIAGLSLAACAAQPVTPEIASLVEIQQEYPDMSAVEFEALDTNNDGVLDAEERMAIGNENDPDGIDVSDG